MRDLLGHTSGIGFGPGFGYQPENYYEVSYVPLVEKARLARLIRAAMRLGPPEPGEMFVAMLRY